jgi:hypothetical protein
MMDHAKFIEEMRKAASSRVWTEEQQAVFWKIANAVELSAQEPAASQSEQELAAEPADVLPEWMEIEEGEGLLIKLARGRHYISEDRVIDDLDRIAEACRIRAAQLRRAGR